MEGFAREVAREKYVCTLLTMFVCVCVCVFVLLFKKLLAIARWRLALVGLIVRRVVFGLVHFQQELRQ